MKTKLLSMACLLATNLVFTYCTENPKDKDPMSTITPGNKSDVDSATAHRSNTDSATAIKINRGDSSSRPGNKDSIGTKTGR
jgi:hypothetical protein